MLNEKDILNLNSVIKTLSNMEKFISKEIPELTNISHDLSDCITELRIIREKNC